MSIKEEDYLQTLQYLKDHLSDSHILKDGLCTLLGLPLSIDDQTLLCILDDTMRQELRIHSEDY